ncbi:Terminal uridylyltransferase 4 [Pseudolycoriella hygida]|uniref:Terminal uridylyltransferase 4 n=1 Tax=Pseudolycoriella hygida TaxID=35572 RepID=A0A9Q0MWR7_9DIPT|nr:Terminal uridylyltransferase 4 [Pseudolycoriella hygida]
MDVKAWRSMHDAVRNALVHCEPGSELDVLLQTLLHDHPIDRVKEDVLTGFQTYYTTTFRSDQVHVFGSTVMGITFEDSDLDFYVELPDCDRVKPRTRRIKIARQILESTKQFTNFQSITAPRVPILKCTHIATRTNIDLNCSNQYGSLNSPIIAHLLRFDRRIHQLAIIIKYWMKIHDCSGSNRISHYSVILMLIFYLQTLPEPIVPPIVEFQRNVPPIMVDNYNFAFDYSLPNRTANRSEWPELLLGFFNFYQDFDYSSLLISPLYGKTYFKTDVKRKNVQNLQRCEEMLSADRSEQPIHLGKGTLCIQDPFEIDREISAGVFFKVLQNFIWKLGYAVEIIEGELPKGVTKSMFLQIFDVAAFNKDLDRMRPQQKQQKPKASKGNAEQKLSSLDVDAHHILKGRKFKESKNDTWTKELLESTNRFRKKSIQGVPLKLSAKITANAENFDYVSIELRDEIKTKRQNFFEAFRQDFIGRIVYFLDIYFIHRYKMAESVDVNSSNSKQCIESAASASTLTMALTRREREIRRGTPLKAYNLFRLKLQTSHSSKKCKDSYVNDTIERFVHVPYILAYPLLIQFVVLLIEYLIPMVIHLVISDLELIASSDPDRSMIR